MFSVPLEDTLPTAVWEATCIVLGEDPSRPRIRRSQILFVDADADADVDAAADVDADVAAAVGDDNSNSNSNILSSSGLASENAAVFQALVAKGRVDDASTVRWDSSRVFARPILVDRCTDTGPGVLGFHPVSGTWFLYCSHGVVAGTRLQQILQQAHK